jgi:uncharacterized delta-60 repeat protein
VCAPAALAAAGDLDGTWGSGGVARTAIGGGGDAWGQASAIQGAKLVVAGRARDGGDVKVALARYNGNGSLDTSFGNGGTALLAAGDAGEAHAFDVAIDSAGRIVVAGYAIGMDQQRLLLARFDANGHSDASFGTGGVALHPIGTAWSVVMDGDRIVVAGSDDSGDVLIARFDGAGNLDPSFSGGAVTTALGQPGEEAVAMGLVRDANGRYVVAGTVGDLRLAYSNRTAFVARYTASGAPDDSFGSGGVTLVPPTSGQQGFTVRDVGMQGDKPVVAGEVAFGGSVHDVRVARFDPQGALDSSFGGFGWVTTPVGSEGQSGARAVAIAPDGKIVVAGYANDAFDTDGYEVEIEQPMVIRYERDGALDGTFGTHSARVGTSIATLSAGGDAYDVVLQPDGKPLLAGMAPSGSSASDFVALRFLSNDSQPSGGGGGGPGQPPVEEPCSAADDQRPGCQRPRCERSRRCSPASRRIDGTKIRLVLRRDAGRCADVSVYARVKVRRGGRHSARVSRVTLSLADSGRRTIEAAPWTTTFFVPEPIPGARRRVVATARMKVDGESRRVRLSKPFLICDST